MTWLKFMHLDLNLCEGDVQLQIHAFRSRLVSLSIHTIWLKFMHLDLEKLLSLCFHLVFLTLWIYICVLWLTLDQDILFSSSFLPVCRSWSVGGRGCMAEICNFWLILTFSGWWPYPQRHLWQFQSQMKSTKKVAALLDTKNIYFFICLYLRNYTNMYLQLNTVWLHVHVCMCVLMYSWYCALIEPNNQKGHWTEMASFWCVWWLQVHVLPLMPSLNYLICIKNCFWMSHKTEFSWRLVQMWTELCSCHYRVSKLLWKWMKQTSALFSHLTWMKCWKLKYALGTLTNTSLEKIHGWKSQRLWTWMQGKKMRMSNHITLDLMSLSILVKIELLLSLPSIKRNVQPKKKHMYSIN